MDIAPLKNLSAYVARVRALGGEVFGGDEAQAATFLKAQQALWGQVVRERRITRD